MTFQIHCVGEPVTRLVQFSTSESWRESLSCRVTTPGVEIMTAYQSVEVAARTLGFGNYSNYLRSDHWLNLKRQKNLKAHGCCVCGRKNLLLAHHIHYRNLLDVTLDDIAVMCMECHDDFHMACRYNEYDYIGMGAQIIRDVTDAFRTTDYYVRRVAKLKRRAALRAAKSAKRLPTNLQRQESKREVRRRFRQFLKSDMGKSETIRLCEWLSQRQPT